MAKKVFDAVATVGKYNDREGNEKSRYQTVGAVFEDDKGRMSMKLEALPISKDWNGWVSFYAPKEQSESRQHQDKPAKEASNSGGGFNDFESDIPFNSIGRGAAAYVI